MSVFFCLHPSTMAAVEPSEDSEAVSASPPAIPVPVPVPAPAAPAPIPMVEPPAREPGPVVSKRHAWILAVAQSVAALGRVVSDFIDVTATRILPTYGGVMGALRRYGRDEAVPGFQAAWDELYALPDGRAVIAVCLAAATRGVLLGRLHFTRAAADPDVEAQLQVYFKDTVTLPTLLAAARYYRAHVAPPVIAEVLPPEWPSLDGLQVYRRGVLEDGTPPQKWHLAVAPAMTVLQRIVGRLVNVRAALLLPIHDVIGMVMQDAGWDDRVPRFEAEWEELRSTPNGRAVIAVCATAGDAGVALGWYGMPQMAASVPDLVGTLNKDFAAGGGALLPRTRCGRSGRRGCAGGGGGCCGRRCRSCRIVI